MKREDNAKLQPGPLQLPANVGAASPMVDMQLLGGFSLLVDGQRNRAVNAPRLQALLAFLVLHQGVPQNRTHVAAQLWPEVDESTARTNLRKFLYKLKQAFPESDAFLETGGSSLLWREDPALMLDVAHLRTQLNRPPSSEQVGLLLQLYRGQLLPGCYDDWLEAIRSRLQQEVSTVLQAQLVRLQRQGDIPSAIQICKVLIEMDPLHEDFHRNLMRLYILAGDRTAARQVYQAYCERLSAEGEQPDADFQAEFQRLTAPPTKELERAAPILLIGREPELRRLGQLWKDARNGSTRIIVLSGEAGVGKTQLLRGYESRLSQERVRILHTRGFEHDAGLSYMPLVELLRSLPLEKQPAATLTELARLLPELLEQTPGLMAPQPMTEPWQQLRFHRAILSVIQTRDPLLLLLDDLQFFDAPTLQFIHRLLRASSKAPLLILGTIRTDVLDVNPFLKDSFLPLAQRDGLLIEIPLTPLDADATRELTSALMGTPVDAGAASQLFDRTHGHPLFVVEMVRAGLLEHGARHPLRLPSSLRAVIESRLSGLGKAAMSLLALCAIAGETFEVEPILRCAGGAVDAQLDALEMLVRRQILIESKHTCRFSHAIIQQVAYERISEARRLLLHRRLGHALLETLGRPDARTLARAARHFEMAGDFPSAIERYLEAAQASAATYANEDARAHFEHTLSLLDSHPNSDLHWKALSGLLELLMMVARPGETSSRLEQLETLYSRYPNPERRLTLQHLRADDAWRSGNYLRAYTCADEGLALARALQSHRIEIQLLTLQGKIQSRRNNLMASAELCAQAANLADAAQEPLLAANARVQLAVADGRRGRLGEAEQELTTSILTYRRLNDKRELAISLGYLAVVYGFVDRGDEGESCLLQAIELSRELQDLGPLARHLNNLGVYRFNDHRFRSGIEVCQESIQVADSIFVWQTAGWARLTLTRAYVAIGLLETARQVALKGLEVLSGLDPCWEYSVFHAELASISTAMHEGVAAMAHLEDGLQFLEKHPDAFVHNQKPCLQRLELEAALALVELGQLEAADRRLDRALQLEITSSEVEEMGSPGLSSIVQATVRLHQARLEEAEICLRPLFQRLHSDPLSHMQPHRALLLYSRILRSLGQSKEALQALREARSHLMRLRAHVRGHDELKEQQSSPLNRAILDDWAQYGAHR